MAPLPPVSSADLRHRPFSRQFAKIREEAPEKNKNPTMPVDPPLHIMKIEHKA